MNNPLEKEKVCGVVKGAALIDDSLVPDLIAISVNDSKPTNFMSTRCETVQWAKKRKSTRDKSK